MIDVSYERFLQEPKLYLDMVISGEKVNIVSSVKEIELTLKENKEENNMLKLEIKTGGAAFSEDDVLTYEGRSEIARLLRKISLQIETGDSDGVIIDINGNKVGRWSLD